MGLNIRLFLIIGSLLTLVYFISRIRKSQLKINHSIFWTVFGFALLILACIPSSIFQISKYLGFQSPSNLVYLVVIFLLMLKQFTNTMRISKLNEQVTALTQAVAIYKLDAEEASTEADAKTGADLIEAAE